MSSSKELWEGSQPYTSKRMWNSSFTHMPRTRNVSTISSIIGINKNIESKNLSLVNDLY